MDAISVRVRINTITNRICGVFEICTGHCVGEICEVGGKRDAVTRETQVFKFRNHEAFKGVFLEAQVVNPHPPSWDLLDQKKRGKEKSETEGRKKGIRKKG